MVRNIRLVIAFLLISTAGVFAQGAIKGKLTDKNTKEGIPFANVIAEVNGALVAGANTDINGEFIIKPLNPGVYDIKASYIGYQPKLVKGVQVGADKTTYLKDADLALSASSVELKNVEIVDYKKPLVDPDTKSGGSVTREEYQAMAAKDINSVAATTAGVYQADAGAALNMRGQRDAGTSYYVDGQRVIGSATVPQGGVEQVSVITGGVPASYGDATGGVVSITTRGPQSEYFGGVEMITSEFLDKFGYNFLGFSAGGPLLLKKDSANPGVKNSVLGFFVSGEGTYDKDPNPSAIGMYKVNDAKLKQIEQTPLLPAPQGQGFVPSADYLTMSDLQHIDARQNMSQVIYRLAGKIDYKPSANINFTVGGSVDHIDRHAFYYEYALLNPANNPQVIENTWRVYAKVTQKFGNNAPMTKDAKEKSASNISNAYYTIQAGYGNYHKIQQDPVHQNNLFDYGYYGTFNQYKARTFAPGNVVYNGNNVYGYVQTGNRDSALTFTPSNLNPLDANYTSAYYNYVGAQNVTTGSQVQQGQGLLNGDHPAYIYSLWYGTGGNRGSYEYDVVDQTQVTMKANFSADVFKNHAVQVGFEYDQRAESQYAIGATSLWTLMRQLANYHLTQLDVAHPIYVPGGTYDYFYYNRKYDAGSQTQFDKSLRQALGMPINGTNWVDIDSYQPSLYNMKMFSADDLLNQGGYPYIHYFGYDYTGAKLTGNPSFSDFFTAKDANGNFARNIPAFRPIYMAGYIQDKFDFRDIKFNVGLRIDRYDANELMLKDKYLLYDARTAGEVNSNTFPGYTRPSNIGSDYTVYVNAVNNPTAVVGYRSGNNWYDQNGTIVQDPSLLAKATQSGNITPWLVNPNQTAVTSSAFTAYVPQVNFMPRIAFAFPISEQANFFAHYDVLTQRPTQSGINSDDPINRLNPVDYLYIQSVQGNILNNPALKPERTTDYELGFTQVLSEKKNSALTLSAFYREMRDMIQIVKVNQAYPVSYLSWDNIDFGTVKGFTASYDLRRSGGVSLNASYTLQFADGTGSGVADGYNLVNSNQPNLRTTIPLNFDQRHSIVVNVDYRFGSGGTYHGPVYTKKKDGKAIKILNNVGANLTARLGSGTPYSAQSNATPEAQTALGVASRATLEGNVNGQRLPWSYRMDLRIDKNIDLTWGGKKEGSAKKAAGLNVYVQVLNLLNTQNILHVYRYTGNPNDDGYINDGAAQSVIAAQASQQSFRDLYSLKVNNPANYSLPRRIRLGVMLNF
jgi:hypothetical protein